MSIHRVDPAVLDALCPEITTLLQLAVAQGRSVVETSEGWPGERCVWVSGPVEAPADLHPRVEHRAVDDPHYWHSEFECLTHHHVLACAYDPSSRPGSGGTTP
jgi:hypothetical protein